MIVPDFTDPCQFREPEGAREAKNMNINQKGEGKAGAVFGFALFVLIVYLAYIVVPVMLRVYAFEDAVKEECKFLHGRGMEALEKDLVEIAQQKELPVTEQNINIAQVKSENHFNLKVDIIYMVPITTPFFTYDWNQVINYEAPVFE